MLIKARERSIYAELVAAELTAYLAGQPRAFDVVICADTLCYFGDLVSIGEAAARALKPAGLLVFTVEALDAARQGARRRRSRLVGRGAGPRLSLYSSGP
jgi:predicted TPR repeat methyltransferase